MSEIDFKDPIFCQELAISERQSLDCTDPDKDINFAYHQFEQSIPDHPTPLAKASYPSKNRMSETMSTRRPHPITLNNLNILRSYHVSSTALPESRLSDDFKRTNDISLEPIKDEDEFQCKNCTQIPDPNCAICNGKKIVKGSSNMVRFFEYIIAFKMRAKESYKERKLTNFSKNSVNNFCHDFYSNKANNSGVRQTIGVPRERLSTTTKRCDKEEIQHELNTIVAVHENYKCDHCQQSPIKGPRYHCLECEDYDECEDCHRNTAHNHRMDRIDKCGRGKQLETIVNLLAMPHAYSNRSSLRPPPTIQRNMDCNKSTRSAIR